MDEDHRGVVTFGVIGTHRLKGVSIAVEAFRQLTDVPARLSLYGGLPEAVADDLPANCLNGGAYKAADLERVFASFDVLLVPSLWFENAPFVIREAFARGKPVIASDLGGMAESVRDSIDGLRFPMGDARALAGCVRRVVEEPNLLAQLQQGIRQPKFFEEHLAELDTFYAEAISVSGNR